MANISRGNGWLLIAGAGLALYACSGPSEDEQLIGDELGVSTEEASEILSGYSSAEEAIDDYRDDKFDEDEALAAAEAELASESYDGSYGCTDDCSGHEAGWAWRAENGYEVQDPDTYGNSDSFAEGAMAYEEAVDNRVEEMREESEY